MKHADVNSGTHIDYGIDYNNKDPKFKVVHYVRISKYRNISAKVYTPNLFEVFLTQKIKKAVPWTYIISPLNSEANAGTFHEKQKKNKN